MATSDYRVLYAEINCNHPPGSFTIVLEHSAVGADDGHYFIFQKNGKFDVKPLEADYKPSMAPYRYFPEKNRQSIEKALYGYACPEGADVMLWVSSIVMELDRDQLVTMP
ncbi:hypothetical protein NLG97_g6701 [Lecanicillium saksenae]|uniref:Uncharacterized protein n=1 Tax=Lecanicillium saksenae TaxID=468837 RepID=A0ACC1QR85_9HYPO|nr:hypothetical protein NLG97_g6701 [Lecanicillium saksenae]